MVSQLVRWCLNIVSHFPIISHSFRFISHIFQHPFLGATIEIQRPYGLQEEIKLEALRALEDALRSRDIEDAEIQEVNGLIMG